MTCIKPYAAAALAAIALGVSGGVIVVEPNGLQPKGALERIRAAKAVGNREAWTVRVKPGHYALKEPLVFLPADSGTPVAPVTWIGEGDVVLAGGECLRGWRDVGGGVWSADAPKAPDGRTAYFEQLWVNDRRAARARLPNRGHFHLQKAEIIADPNDAGRFVETVVMSNAEVRALARISAAECQYAQMCLVHKWSFARRIVRGFDAVTGTVTTWSPFPWQEWQRWNERETFVHFENVRGGFDAPGEWFYDASAGKVLYRPLPGEDMLNAVAVAPNANLSRLVVFCGDPDRGRYVHDVIFRQIGIGYSAVTSVAGCKAGGPTQSWQRQAASESDGAVTLVGAHRISFEECRVRHTGNYGLRFNDGCVSNRVVGCLLEDLGAGGVWMGASTGNIARGEVFSRRIITALTPRSTAFNRIEDCTIRKGGRFNPEGTGVAFTHVSDSSVLHCDIHDFFYTGVSVGWAWGFRGSVAQCNKIAFNRIHDLGKGVMSDMGGVYTLGTSFGTKVHDNVIHDIWSGVYGGWALYADEGSEGITMERNLCWNTTDGGFRQHYGTGCVVRNNIFAWNKTRGAVSMTRREVQGIPCTLHFVNNIVLVKEGPLVGKGTCGVGGVWANNLWWDVSGRPDLDGSDWTEWMACGKETGGRYADPQFADASGYDFHLKPTSPAFELGFKAWDFTQAGSRR